MSQDNSDNLTKKRAPYWIPGVNGILLEEALALMAYGTKAMKLTVTKKRVNPIEPHSDHDPDEEQSENLFYFHIDIKNLE